MKSNKINLFIRFKILICLLDLKLYYIRKKFEKKTISK